MMLDSAFKDRTFITAAEIALQMGVNDLTVNRKLANQIANVMVNRFGWRKGRDICLMDDGCVGMLSNGTL